MAANPRLDHFGNTINFVLLIGMVPTKLVLQSGIMNLNVFQVSSSSGKKSLNMHARLNPN